MSYKNLVLLEKNPFLAVKEYEENLDIMNEEKPIDIKIFKYQGGN